MAVAGAMAVWINVSLDVEDDGVRQRHHPPILRLQRRLPLGAEEPVTTAGRLFARIVRITIQMQTRKCVVYRACSWYTGDYAYPVPSD